MSFGGPSEQILFDLIHQRTLQFVCPLKLQHLIYLQLLYVKKRAVARTGRGALQGPAGCFICSQLRTPHRHPAAQSSYTTKGTSCLGEQKRELPASCVATRALSCPSGTMLYILFSKLMFGIPPARKGTPGCGAKGGMIILKSFVRIHSSKL